MARKPGDGGFTYVELIIAVSIIALTLAFSGPSLERFAKQSKTKAAAREVYGRLQQARMTAIKENVSIPAVFTNTGAGIMTTTYPTSGNQVLDLSVEAHLRGAYLDLSSSPVSITFGPNGTANPNTVTLRHSDGSVNAFAVVVNNGGGIRIERRP